MIKPITLAELFAGFDKHQIIALGETHHGKHENVFKELDRFVSNFDEIFYEKPISDQGSLDNYIKTGKLDTRLNELIEGAKYEGKDIRGTLITILNFSRNHQIPIVAIDSSKKQTDVYYKKSEIGNYYHKGDSREEDMFNNIIENCKDGQKYLLICGARHLTLGKHNRSNVDTLGTRLQNKFGDKLLRVALVSDQIEHYIQDFDYYLA